MEMFDGIDGRHVVLLLRSEWIMGNIQIGNEHEVKPERYTTHDTIARVLSAEPRGHI